MNVSRRNWLAAAGASMLLPRSIQAADLHGSGDPDVWPVVVVGSGLAGLSAAYSAMQNAAALGKRSPDRWSQPVLKRIDCDGGAA